MIVLGIDPGLNGGLAWYETDYDAIDGVPMPAVKARGRGREVDWQTLAAALRDLPVDHAYLELVSARPGEGVASAFKFGQCLGGLRGALATLCVPVTLVTPQKWKRAVGVGAAKDASLARARELWPARTELFARKKDEGVAEAALIAYYGARDLRGGRDD